MRKVDETQDPDDLLLRRDRGKQFVNLVVCTIAKRTWSQLVFVACLPFQLALIFHPNTALVETGMRHLKILWDSYVCIEGIVRGRLENFAEITILYNDLYFARTPLVRELCLLAESGKWSLRFQPLREVVWNLFGAIAQSKTRTEDPFSFTKDQSLRTSKANNMSLDRMFEAYYDNERMKTEGRDGANDILVDPGDEEDNEVLDVDEDRMVHIELDRTKCADHIGPGTMAVNTAAWYNIHGWEEEIPDALPIQNLTLPTAEQAWQPAGPSSLRNMGAAASYVLERAHEKWKFVGRSWACCLMHRGLMFVHRPSGGFWLSLGCAKYVWLGVPMMKLEDSAGNFFYAPAVGFNLSGQLMGEKVTHYIQCNHAIKDVNTVWAGIPTECGHADTLSHELRGRGFQYLWKQTHESDWILRHAFRNEVPLTYDELDRISKTIRLFVPRPAPRQGLRAIHIALALAIHIFPEEDLATQRALAHGVTTARETTIAEADSLKAVMEALDEHNRKEVYDCLYKHVDKATQNKHKRPENRIGGKKGPQRNFTPKDLKCLVPQAGEGRSYIVLQSTHKQVSAYYPGASPTGSTSRVWEGFRGDTRDRTMVDAITMVLDWLWFQESKYRLTSDGKPTAAEIIEAVTKFVPAPGGAGASPAPAADPPAGAAGPAPAPAAAAGAPAAKDAGAVPAAKDAGAAPAAKDAGAAPAAKDAGAAPAATDGKGAAPKAAKDGKAAVPKAAKDGKAAAPKAAKGKAKAKAKAKAAAEDRYLPACIALQVKNTCNLQTLDP